MDPEETITGSIRVSLNEHQKKFDKALEELGAKSPKDLSPDKWDELKKMVKGSIVEVSLPKFVNRMGIKDRVRAYRVYQAPVEGKFATIIGTEGSKLKVLLLKG